MLGIEIPDEPEARRRAAEAAVRRSSRRLSEASVDDLVSMPAARNQVTIDAGELIGVLMSAAVLDADLIALLSSHGVELALDDGPTGSLALTLSRYGPAVGHRLDDDALVALLYLEHRHLAGAFTEGQVALLQVLCTQAAISLENARIYTDLEEAFARLRHRSLHDELTELANRALLLEHLRVALARAARHESSVAVLYLDLDDFKQVNDSIGHWAGDALLVEVARRLARVCRETDTAARLGGDEFAVLCVDLIDERQPERIARRIAAELEAPFPIAGTELRVTASLGIVLQGDTGQEAEDVLQAADLAMYRAKRAGKARHEYFDEGHRARVISRLRVHNELHHALRSGEIEIHYQPVFRLSDRTVVGFEALCRWQHPTRGLVYPAEFLDIAEESDLIAGISGRVLRGACEQAVAWRRATGIDVLMSVNLSVRQLDRGEFHTELARVLTETGIEPGLLMLEVTESLLFDERASAQLGAIDNLGVRLGIDDFGTGYSSLSYLKRLPVSCLKIDRSFVSGLGEIGPHDPAIVEAVVALARTLGLDTIAEGIETDAQLSALAVMGCAFGQGFLVSPPVPAAEAERLLAV